MKADRVAAIEAALNKAFSPDHLLVKDQSHLHAGHAGARDGRGHFDVSISAAAFLGCSRIDAHKLVYSALGELMTTDIHALRIKASSSGNASG
ncbi:MAG: BolA family transcriptional regulator [Planctomycetaceae bacterium]|nr:BolA family transcriptional regulator [Planctomycetaceae bacterium]